MASNQDDLPDDAPTETPSGNEAVLDLKILSPSSGFPQEGIHFRRLPIATTVSELRDRITATLPSHPSSDRQRLIYLGRVLQRGEDSLATVFGETAVQQQAQRTLHLVLRDHPNQVQAAPTTATTPIQPSVADQASPSLIPRPSSVPPPSQRTSSRSPSPLRPSPTSGATIPQLGASPSDPASIVQQGQPRPPPSNEQSFRVGLGNAGHAHAHLRATVTQNGQPVNLPPEVINQLLNQHFLRNGGLPELFNNNQQRPQQSDSATPPTATPIPQQPRQGLDTLQQFMAMVTPPTGVPEGQLAPDTSRGQQGHSDGSADQERGRAEATQSAPSDNVGEQNASTNAPQAHSTNAQEGPRAQADQDPQPSQPPQPVSHEASGVTPDGRHWTARTIVTGHEGHMHRHSHAPQFHPHPHPHPAFPTGVPQAFPSGFPLPMMQQGMSMAMPIPLAAPVAGLRPQGTSRSGSPARPANEGPRRIGTPAAELQHRLMHTNQEIQNLQQLLGILAGGTMVTGQPAPPLAEEQLNQIRAYADSMNAHIQGFGNDLSGLANTHPGVRFQPEYASLAAAFNALRGQGRTITTQIQNLADATASSQRPPQMSTSAPPSGSTPPPSDIQQPPPVAVSQSGNPPIESGTPATSSDTPPMPSLMSEAVRPSEPGLHLLSDPTSTQHYLLVGPSGPLGTGTLPLDVLYPLLATQLPHDQLVSQFATATREMARALQRSDLRNTMNVAQRLRSGQQRQGGSSRTSEPSSAAPSTTAASSSSVPVPVPEPAPAAAQPAGHHHIVRGEPAPAGQAPARIQPPDEMRELLAPIIRNLWLIIRILVFGYFFFSSGKGYGRLVIIGVLGSIVWAVNAGMFGPQVGAMWEAVRRHFEEVVDEARGQTQANTQPAQPTGNGEGSSGQAAAAGSQLPTPEETARRLMVERANGQRRRIGDVIRQAERTIALGLASLWPGVGEAVAQNAERTRREEARRTAEAEIKRKAEEEERKRKAAEGEKGVTSITKSEMSGGSTIVPSSGEASSSGTQATDLEGVGRVNKGKERAD